MAGVLLVSDLAAKPGFKEFVLSVALLIVVSTVLGCMLERLLDKFVRRMCRCLARKSGWPLV